MLDRNELLPPWKSDQLVRLVAEQGANRVVDEERPAVRRDLADERRAAADEIAVARLGVGERLLRPAEQDRRGRRRIDDRVDLARA